MLDGAIFLGFLVSDPELTINLGLLFPIFRHFYQVNFSCQNIVKRKDEVGLDIRFSGVHGNSYAEENLEEVVVVEQHGIQIDRY